MKFNDVTFWIGVFTLVLYTIYIMSAKGLVGLLVSLAGGLVIAAFVDKFEFIVAAVVVLGIVYVMGSNIINGRSFCGTGAEGFTTSPEEIVKRIEEVKTKRSTGSPSGLLSKAVEGFADAGEDNDDDDDDGEPPESTPAPTKDAVVTPGDDVKKNVEKNLQKAAENREEFSSNSKGLFKLGEMPSESADGPHIDTGSTLIKAMNALQPDQINSMTSDTKQLLETQQNLMGMLKNMAPVLQDGRKLLDSFSGIFGGEGHNLGAGLGAGLGGLGSLGNLNTQGKA